MYTEIQSNDYIRAVPNFLRALKVSLRDGSIIDLAAASRNVRRSLGCFSFLLSLLLLTGARKKARHWKNFEFEIPPRYSMLQ